MLSMEKYTTLWILVHILVNICYSHQLQSGPTANPNGTTGNIKNDGSDVEDIVQDTILLLDALDQKLASVKNKTPNAMMRDNLRYLNGADEDEYINQPNAAQSDDASMDEALVSMANGFTSARKSDKQQASLTSEDPLISAASEPHSLTMHQLVNRDKNISHNSESLLKSLKGQKHYGGLSVDSGNIRNNDNSDDSKNGLSNNNRSGLKRARQLQVATALDPEDQLTNDSTERHIRFTLDLMQSIFSSQSYTAKTNQIESFLISPLSIQMVLMMMHLGARGQTRREISNCLHLTSSASSHQPATLINSDKTPLLSTSSSQQHQLNGGNNLATDSAASRSKRRHPQNHLTQGSSSISNINVGTSNENSKQSTNGKLDNQAVTNSRQQQQISSGSHSTNTSPHELFGSSMRNLLKDPIVMKALTSANQIFLQKNLPLSAQYEWAIRHYYGADVKLVDFHHLSSLSNTNLPHNGAANAEKAKLSNEMGGQNLTQAIESNANFTDTSSNSIQQIVNEWIERQTKGRISNFLSSPIPTSTLLMAINVLYLKGDWQYKFDPTDTESDAWFTQADGSTVKIPMMVNRLPLAFAHDPVMKTSVIELPYKAQRLGLFLLLPDEVSGIFHTMQMLNSTSFANLISSMRKPSPTADQSVNGINVRIPKFSIESSPRLSQILSQKLGLKSLFMPDSADLSGMFASLAKHRSSNGTSSSSVQNKSATENSGNQQVPLQVGLDELLHKAVLQVDEQGSVAAASSATIVERVGLFNSNYFEADHPFLLFLMDKQTGLVLFSGAFAGNAHDSNNKTKGANPNAKNSDINRKQN